MKSTNSLKKLFLNKKIGSKANKKTSSSKGKIYISLGMVLLFPLTLWGTTQNFSVTMMLLTTFGLAYVSKGMRKPKSQHFSK